MRTDLQTRHDNLVSCLKEELQRGRRLLDRTRISSDGTAGALELWENDVAMILESIGRPDLVARFEAAEFALKARAAFSGPWSTKTRLNRRLETLGAINEGEH